MIRSDAYWPRLRRSLTLGVAMVCLTAAMGQAGGVSVTPPGSVFPPGLNGQPVLPKPSKPQRPVIPPRG